MENTVTLIRNRQERVPFIEGDFLPAGENEYYLRDTQVKRPENGWRHLRFDEIERLVKNQNTSDNWDNILVTDQFEPKLIKNNKFYGMVRIGAIPRPQTEGGHHQLAHRLMRSWRLCGYTRCALSGSLYCWRPMYFVQHPGNVLHQSLQVRQRHR